MTSDPVASPKHGKRRRLLLVIAVLGLLALLGTITNPWLSSWTFSSERNDLAPVRFTVFDFEIWGYGYVLGVTGLAVLLITTFARPEVRGRRLVLVTIAAGALGLVSFLVVNWQIHRYEIAARTRWSDVLWAVQQRGGAYDIVFYRTGLESGILALYVLGAGVLLAFSPRERSLKVLAAVTSFALVLWIPLPWRVKWITDATALEYHYQLALTAGRTAYLLAATTVILAFLLILGAQAAVSRRWVLPWLTSVAVLAVVGLGMGLALVNALPSTTEDFERKVDIEFTQLDAPISLALWALLLVLFVAVPIARAWHRTAKEREQFQPVEATMAHASPGQEQLALPLVPVEVAQSSQRTTKEREQVQPAEATTADGPNGHDKALGRSSRSRWRIVVAGGTAAVVISAVSATLKEDEAAKSAEVCTDLANAIRQAESKLTNVLTARPQDASEAARDAGIDFRSAASKTDNQDIVRAVLGVAEAIEQAPMTNRLDPQAFEQLYATLANECGRPTAR